MAKPALPLMSNSSNEIVAGLTVATTGRYARSGQQALDGIRLWQSYINESGGMVLAGRQLPVRLLYYNNQSRVSPTRRNVLRLLHFDRVSILFGPYASVLALAAAEEATRQQRLLWNHGGASDEIATRGFRVVSGLSPASDYLRGLPALLVERWPQLRRICLVLKANGTFAFDVARGLKEAVEETRAHELHNLLFIAPFNQDALISGLTALQPEVVVLAGAYEGETSILRERSRWPASVKVTAAVAAGVNVFGEDLQGLAEGVIGPSQWEPEVQFDNIRGPDSRWFMENFQLRFGSLPEYMAASSFALGLIVSECVRQCGSVEDEALLNAAAALDCNTFYGRFRIDPATGLQVGHRVLLVQWQGGRKVVLRA